MSCSLHKVIKARGGRDPTVFHVAVLSLFTPFPGRMWHEQSFANISRCFKVML